MALPTLPCKRLLHTWLAAWAVLAAHPGALAQADLVLNTVNRLRSAGGACAAGAPPVRAQARLDAAARALAQGSTLDGALRTAGFRATRAQLVQLSGPALRLQLESLLGRNYCTQVVAPDLTQLGVHIDGDRWWILLAAPFAPHVDLSPAQMAERMLAGVNRARAQSRRCGDKAFAAAAPLRWNTTLARAAQGHAADMAGNDYFSHTGRDGSSPGQRVQAAGYRYRSTGENLAAGDLTLEAAIAGWLQSPGHCATLMQPQFTEMGAAFAVDAKSRMGIYWVQSFGRPQ